MWPHSGKSSTFGFFLSTSKICIMAPETPGQKQDNASYALGGVWSDEKQLHYPHLSWTCESLNPTDKLRANTAVSIPFLCDGILILGGVVCFLRGIICDVKCFWYLVPLDVDSGSGCCGVTRSHYLSPALVLHVLADTTVPPRAFDDLNTCCFVALCHFLHPEWLSKYVLTQWTSWRNSNIWNEPCTVNGSFSLKRVCSLLYLKEPVRHTVTSLAQGRHCHRICRLQRLCLLFHSLW